tara:strand:- start:2527 stop:5016 length:2490 start_codon:yes stop_codon:yes gene_type:complete
MGRIKIDYGIDLGTTNSALARMENGEVVVLEYDQSRIVPSCVYIDKKSRTRVGKTAKSTFPHFFEFKRDIGQDIEFDVLDGSKTNPEKLSAELLKKLASEITDEAFKSVVITVPAAFELPQISATKRAAQLAGFEQIEILQEPVAAAFNYGLKHKVKDGKFVVFDFGGGTFDAALVTGSGGVMQVKSSEGDPKLGGGDIDRAVVNDMLLPYLRENYSIAELEKKDEKESNYFRHKLKNIADELKKELGKAEEYELVTEIALRLGEDDEGEEIEIDTTFTRSQLNKLTVPFVQRGIDKTKELLKNNELSASDLTALVLVGGPTQMPIFREMIEEQIIKPDVSLNAMTGIAEGAALYASTMQNSVKEHGAGPDSGGEEEVAAIELEVDYSTPSNLDKEPVSVVVKGSPEPLFGEIQREDGVRTERASLDAVFMVNLDQTKANNFTISVFNEKNDRVACSPDKFTILPGIAVDGGSPLPYHIGMDYQAKNGKLLFTPFQGLEKDKPMPATGKTRSDLVTKQELRPGNSEDELEIGIYQGGSKSKDSRSIVNARVGSILLSGSDVPKLVPVNTPCNFTLHIDISQNMTLEADFPTLDFEIEKQMEFNPTAEVSREQVDELLQEADKLVDRLESSNQPPANLSEIKEKRDRIKKILDQDGPLDQAFSNSREVILDLDLAEEKLALPELVGEINEAFKNLEDLVQECVNNSLNGHEKDKSDLEYLKTSKDSVLASTNLERGKELLDKIRNLEWSISDRHAGKERRIAWIRDFHNSFGSIEWTNQAEARIAVNQGMDLVNSGASLDQLQEQVSTIVSYMENRDKGPGPSEGGGVGE